MSSILSSPLFVLRPSACGLVALSVALVGGAAPALADVPELRGTIERGEREGLRYDLERLVLVGGLVPGESYVNAELEEEVRRALLDARKVLLQTRLHRLGMDLPDDLVEGHLEVRMEQGVLTGRLLSVAIRIDTTVGMHHDKRTHVRNFDLLNGRSLSSAELFANSDEALARAGRAFAGAVPEELRGALPTGPRAGFFWHVLATPTGFRAYADDQLPTVARGVPAEVPYAALRGLLNARFLGGVEGAMSAFGGDVEPPASGGEPSSRGFNRVFEGD